MSEGSDGRCGFQQAMAEALDDHGKFWQAASQGSAGGGAGGAAMKKVPVPGAPARIRQKRNVKYLAKYVEPFF
jgi:hypothetical protein